MINLVAVFTAFLAVEPHRKGYPLVGLAREMIMIEPVVLAVHPDPIVRLIAIGLAKTIDNHLCYPAVSGDIIFRSAE